MCITLTRLCEARGFPIEWSQCGLVSALSEPTLPHPYSVSQRTCGTNSTHEVIPAKITEGNTSVQVSRHSVPPPETKLQVRKTISDTSNITRSTKAILIHLARINQGSFNKSINQNPS
jgi:hypothetical protein